MKGYIRKGNKFERIEIPKVAIEAIKKDMADNNYHIATHDCEYCYKTPNSFDYKGCGSWKEGLEELFRDKKLYIENGYVTNGDFISVRY
jgi:hypothetical protein